MASAVRTGLRKLPLWIAAILFFGIAKPAYSQYPGSLDAKKNTGPTLRAVAVLEWTGKPGKPSASRMIPISVFDGEDYQPAGLYLAQPEPLALESGTEYILQSAGTPKGLFDVYNAQEVQGYWFGYGAWKPLAPVQRPKSHPGKILPQVVTDTDSDRPHFKNHGASKNGSDGKNGSGGNGNRGSASQTSTPPPPDPDRPTLRRRPEGSVPSNDQASYSAAETAIGGADPDRPHLTRGKQNVTDAGFEPPKLTGAPLGLEQMIAVSDATDRDPHPFAYAWADTGDAAKMQARLESIAQRAVAGGEPGKPLVQPPARKRTAHRKHASSTAAANPLPTLTNERFKAFELTYSGGATLIFSAQTTASAGKIKYVTLIAQPDFYGVPIVLFKSVTDDEHLDDMPRMRLVDAVDARANGRGDLVFELRARSNRQFAIYRVVNGRVEQVFTTGPLAFSPS